MMVRQGGRCDWAATHQSNSMIDKFGIMGLTRRREQKVLGAPRNRPMQWQPIFLQGVKGPVVADHKLLGIIIDQELHWKEHMNYMLCRGTKWVTQYHRLAKLSWGISTKIMRQFYTTVAVPKLLYTADLFLFPESHISKSTKGFITRLARIQRQASIHITVTLQLSPTDAIDTCADLLPFSLLIDQILFMATSRIAMLPLSHLVEKHVKIMAARYVKCHRSVTHS